MVFIIIKNGLYIETWPWYFAVTMIFFGLRSHLIRSNLVMTRPHASHPAKIHTTYHFSFVKFNFKFWSLSCTYIWRSCASYEIVVYYNLVMARRVNTLKPRQNGRHFADDIFKYIFLNKNVWIPIKISLKFVSKGRINIIPAFVQIMARRRPGDKPLSEPMMVSLPTHICVTRPQWVKHDS